MSRAEGGARRIFAVTRGSDGVALVELDVPGSAKNLFLPGDTAAIERLVTELIAPPAAIAVVLASARRSCFSAGVDLASLDEIRTSHDGVDAARAVQGAIERLRNLRIPIVAAIDGACLGVGLDLALTADHRVVTRSAATRLGYPEVGLGLVPAGGATFHLPRAIGPALALEVLCSGRTVTAAEARRLGLAQEVVAPGEDRQVAHERALHLAALRGRDPAAPSRWLGPLRWAREQLGGARSRAERDFRGARQRWEIHGARRSRAIAAIIDAVVAGLEQGERASLEVERRAFGELVAGRDAVHRRALFRDEAAHRRALSDGTGLPPPSLGLIGAEALPSLLEASVLADAAVVQLLDPDPGAHHRTHQALTVRLDAAVAAGRIDAVERRQALGRLSRPAAGDERAPLVVLDASGAEAGAARVRALEVLGGAEAVYAVTGIGATLVAAEASARHPERWVGLRYLPAPGGALRIAEIASGEATSPEALRLVAAVVLAQGVLPVRIADRAGGCGWRLLAAYVGEALHLVAEGVDVGDVDAALEEWGFEVGPLALLDDIGWATLSGAASELARTVGPRCGIPGVLGPLAASGRGGRALSAGFYQYSTDGRRGRVDPRVRGLVGARRRDLGARAIVDRCVLRVVGEVLACLDEAVVASSSSAAVLAVHGVGFPAGRGGPLRYAVAVGAPELAERTAALAREWGPRFAWSPSSLRWVEAAVNT